MSYETVGEFLDDKCKREDGVLVCEWNDGTEVIPEPKENIKETSFSEENVENLFEYTSLID